MVSGDTYGFYPKPTKKQQGLTWPEVRRVLLYVAAIVLILGVVASLAGCDSYTAKTAQTFDNNAVYSRNIADAAAADKLTPAEQAYYLECFARTFKNLSNAGHWAKPAFASEPTNKPTTLPWTPEGGKAAQ